MPDSIWICLLGEYSPCKSSTFNCVIYYLLLSVLRSLRAAAQETYTQNPDDCIMLVKRYVNSYELSQEPMVFLPSDFKAFMREGLEALPRNLLTDRTKKEFLDIVNNYFLFEAGIGVTRYLVYIVKTLIADCSFRFFR